MYRRVSSTDKAYRMPPAYMGRDKLTDHEIGLLRDWIQQGAKWTPFWSLIPPKRPALPVVQMQQWPRNPIDFFILNRLEREGLQPSPEADKRTLIRRVSLDLTGLPPTPADVDAFLSDNSPKAYDKVVDRLLNSTEYAEHMAYRWMEAARYGDTNGYQTDGPREMWRWRDWVIDAFRHNMPYDEFTVDQLAGDLLPNPTLDQRIATGFNRNHRTSGEGRHYSRGIPCRVCRRPCPDNSERLDRFDHGVARAVTITNTILFFKRIFTGCLPTSTAFRMKRALRSTTAMKNLTSRLHCRSNSRR